MRFASRERDTVWIPYPYGIYTLWILARVRARRAYTTLYFYSYKLFYL